MPRTQTIPVRVRNLFRRPRLAAILVAGGAGGDAPPFIQSWHRPPPWQEPPPDQPLPPRWPLWRAPWSLPQWVPSTGRPLAVPAAAASLFALPAAPNTLWPLTAGSALVSITSNLSWFRGEDVTLTFQTVPAVDITGWAIAFKIAQSLGGAVTVTKTVGLGVTITDGPRGKFQVSIASTDTSGLAPGRYVWDCRRTDPGSRATLADGYLDLKQEVTA